MSDESVLDAILGLLVEEARTNVLTTKYYVDFINPLPLFLEIRSEGDSLSEAAFQVRLTDGEVEQVRAAFKEMKAVQDMFYDSQVC